MKGLPKNVERALAGIPRELPPGRKFVVIAPFCWGAGKTIDEAHHNALRNRARSYEGPAGWRFILFDAPEDAYVDGMGLLRWTIPEGADEKAIEARELIRVGKFPAVK